MDIPQITLSFMRKPSQYLLRSRKIRESLTSQLENITHSLLTCCGCDEIHYLFEAKEWELSGDNEEQLILFHMKRYPPAITRRHPEWLRDRVMPNDIRDFLTEIYVARQNENLRLCALGIRALIEQIMLRTIADTGKLGLNIDAFFAAGYVAPRDQDHFRRKVIGVGDAAMHRGYTPEPQEIERLARYYRRVGCIALRPS